MRPLFAVALLAVPAFAAFPNGYSYCKVVTTQHAMVSGANDLTNYPLTVILTDADLRTTGNGGLVNNANGYDIGFYPDCSGSGAALKWEMESYSPTTGAIVAHVLRPTLSHATNDTIGMFYGGLFSSFQSTASAVWDSNYKGVWHLGGSSTPNLADSTSVNNLTSVGSTTSTSGQIDGAASFNESNYLINSTAAGIPISGRVTLSCWLMFTDTPLFRTAVNYSNGSTGSLFAILAESSSVYAYVNGSDHLSSALQPNTSYNVSFVFDTVAGSVTFYINGQLDKTYTGLTLTMPAAEVFIGSLNGSNGPWSGWVDEVRISNSARSADWILTEYRNQSAPGTYISAGSRVAAGAGTRIRHLVTGGF